MSVEIISASLNDKPLLAEMMQVYMEELSEFADLEPDDDGEFEYAHFDAYWTEPTRHPLMILAEGAPVGFCLVRKLESDLHTIAEFYVEEPYRGAGIGTLAAHIVFSQFPGRWQVAELADHHLAQAFWNRAIRDYTGGNYGESWSNKDPEGPMQAFSTPED